MMRRILLGLSPCVAGAVYFFGWRSLGLVVWAGFVGFVTEYLFTRWRGEAVSEAVFVTTTLLALVMPPTVPWHVLTVGTVFAVMFTKEIFGGFGRNIFNPALTGRAFIYISFGGDTFQTFSNSALRCPTICRNAPAVGILPACIRAAIVAWIQTQSNR